MCGWTYKAPSKHLAKCGWHYKTYFAHIYAHKLCLLHSQQHLILKLILKKQNVCIGALLGAFKPVNLQSIERENKLSHKSTGYLIRLIRLDSKQYLPKPEVICILIREAHGAGMK